MFDFLIYNMFVQFGGRVFQQTIDIPMGLSIAPLLADLCLHSFEVDFLQILSMKGKKISPNLRFQLLYII